jgi:hypothetical protein
VSGPANDAPFRLMDDGAVILGGVIIGALARSGG